ncbi:glycosyltransferase family 4 protein [Methanolobus sp.]|uniref:glycosyltransferase family 4 protein n=1 Tax=Methanolobus sp. TaxID=1874737 RepID=UPI0025F33E4F|nr:glycosyltransferase family 4 protein [Methanolobus sp.]
MTHSDNSHRKKNDNVCMVAYRSLPRDINRMKISRSLHNNGYDVDFVSLKYKDHQGTERINDINIIRVTEELQTDNFLTVFTNHILFGIKAFYRISLLNNSQKYSFFHVHNPPDYLILIAIPFKLIYGSRIILDLHDMLPEAVESNLQFKGSGILVQVSKIIEKVAVHFSDAIIATNSYDKEIISARNNVDPDKIFVVMNIPNLKHYTIETAVKEDYGLENRFIVLFEGTIWKRRGIQTVIDAVELLKDTIPICFLVVGDGPSLQYLKDIVVEKDLNDFVKFTGWVDLNTLSKYISIADVCVIPFLKTKVNERGVPNKLFEYTIHEKPIIASRLKGMALTFSEKEILFYEPGNADELAERILWCFKNPEETRKMIISSRQRYEEEYSWDRMEKILYECFESV